MNKTIEELADECLKQAESCCDDCYKDAFLAGYQAAKDQLLEETGLRLKLFKDEDDAKAAYQEALDDSHEQKVFEQGYELGAKESQPQWISVKDRLPEAWDDYLGFGCSPTIPACCFVVAYNPKSNKWYDMLSDSDLTDTILYWRPLPKPPEGGADE